MSYGTLEILKRVREINQEIEKAVVIETPPPVIRHQEWIHIDGNNYDKTKTNIEAVVRGEYENVVIRNYNPIFDSEDRYPLYSQAILNSALIDFAKHGDSIVKLTFLNCTFRHITLFMVTNLIMSARNLKQLTIDHCNFIIDFIYKVSPILQIGTFH